MSGRFGLSTSPRRRRAKPRPQEPAIRRVVVELHPRAFDMLLDLEAQGFHGRSVGEVAERLICSALRELITEDRR